MANRSRGLTEFKRVLEQRDFEKISQEDIVLAGVHDHNEFVVGCPADLRCLFDLPRLSSIAQCATGISTGNDSRYLRSEPSEGHDVPFYKNPGSRKFHCLADAYLPTDFLEIAAVVPNFMVRNRNLLFQAGISCSSMGVRFGACYLPPGSTFGVNPGVFCREEDIWWLLAYLNSRLVSYLVRGVMLRANMITSGYVARIPLVAFDEHCRRSLSNLAKEAYGSAMRQEDTAAVVNAIDEIVYKAAGVSLPSVRFIQEFCNDVVRLT